MKKLTALSTITALIAILTTVTNSTPAFSKSNYFAETEPILIEVHYVTSFGSSEDITAPVSSDEAATSTDKATVLSLKDEDSSRSSRYWAKESFTVNNRKGVIDDTVTSSDTIDTADTANSADQR